MERWVAKRIAIEKLDVSELDDAIIKKLINKYVDVIDALTKEKSPDMLFFHQGQVAILDEVIQILRHENKKKILQQDEEDND